MSMSETLITGHGFGSRFAHGSAAPAAKTVEEFVATGFGSRGGPNKMSNKLRSAPGAYATDALPREQLLATGRRSRGGPNKVSNKLRSRPGSYLFQ